MGKNKYQSKKGSRFTKATEDDSNYERLLAYAEKNGKQIWEVSLNDLSDNDEANEETEECFISSEDKSPTKSIEEVDEKSFTDKLDSLTIGTSNIAVIDINTSNENQAVSSGIQAKSQVDIAIDDQDNDYPKKIKLNDEITKKIEIIDHLTTKENKSIKFGNKLIIYKYPKETLYEPGEFPMPKNDKKKKEKKEKKEHKRPIDDENEIDEEEIRKLEEIRAKREEFAYLAKLKEIEDEERKKQKKLEEEALEKKKEEKKTKKKSKHKKK